MIPTLKMTSVFSLLPYIPQVERGTYDQKCRGGSKISVRKTRKYAVVRACSEQKTHALISISQEIIMSAANFVLPLFIHEGEDDIPIEAMPGCNILGWRHGLIDEVYKARDVGVKSFLLLPNTPNALKIPTTDGIFIDTDLVPRAIRLLKDKYHDIVIYSDLTLDPHFHAGFRNLMWNDDVITYDSTAHHLYKQAVSLARAGADVISPRRLMDERVRGIRVALDEEGFHDVSIMSYAYKYDSILYDPYALHSNPQLGVDDDYELPANCREAIIDVADSFEGADILLVKAILLALHTIRFFRDNLPLPMAAYQVGNVYTTIKTIGDVVKLDEKELMMKTLMTLRRAGANIIFTYFARQAAAVLAGAK